MSSVTETRKLKNTEAVAFHRGKLMVLQSKDKNDIILLSMIDNEEMVEVADHLKMMIKLQAVIEYKNTMEEQILLISACQIVLLTEKKRATIRRHSFIFQRCFSETLSHTAKQGIKELLCITD
jgi:hypothetical protein